MPLDALGCLQVPAGYWWPLLIQTRFFGFWGGTILWWTTALLQCQWNPAQLLRPLQDAVFLRWHLLHYWNPESETTDRVSLNSEVDTVRFKSYFTYFREGKSDFLLWVSIIQVFEKKPILSPIDIQSFWIDICNVQRDNYCKNIRLVFCTCSKRNIFRCILVLNQTM